MLYLTKTERGEPKRFILKEDKSILESNYNNLRLNIPGLTSRKDENGKIFLSLPPEELNIYVLKKLLPSLKLSPEAEQFRNDSVNRRKLLIDIKKSNYKYLHKFLYDFQKADVEFMETAKCSINANVQGSGKTIEAIELIERLFSHKDWVIGYNVNILIVVPNSLKLYWKSEIKKFSGRESTIGKSETFNKIHPIKIDEDNIIIINYEMLRKDKFEDLFEVYWDLVVLDEAHKIKARKAQQTKGSKKLKSKFKILLTGSPVPNFPQDLWSLLNFLFPKRFHSYWQFIERFCIQEIFAYSPVPIITGLRNVSSLKYILESIMVRRSAAEVLKDLPEKRYKIIELEMEGEQKKLYDELEKNMFCKLENGESIEAAIPLTKIIKLRQLALSPAIFGSDDIGVKTREIFDILDDSNEKIVILSMSKLYINLLSKLLNERHWNFVKITGEVSLEERQKAIENFTNNPDVKLFLATLQTGGEGLNLQIASTLIFADKSWSPAQNKQAENRIFRIGQVNKTLIISLICKNSVDESVEKTLKNKNKIINRIMFLVETFIEDLKDRYEK